VLVARLERATY